MPVHVIVSTTVILPPMLWNTDNLMTDFNGHKWSGISWGGVPLNADQKQAILQSGEVPVDFGYWVTHHHKEELAVGFPSAVYTLSRTAETGLEAAMGGLALDPGSDAAGILTCGMNSLAMG